MPIKNSIMILLILAILIVHEVKLKTQKIAIVQIQIFSMHRGSEQLPLTDSNMKRAEFSTELKLKNK